MAKLFVCGDISNYTPGLGFIGDDIIRVIQSADYAICNFEGPEIPLGAVASFPHQEYGTATYLQGVGFNLMLLSNNHITELGADGIEYSISAIKSTKADYLGAGLSWDNAYEPLIREIDGLMFGFVNICEAQPGCFKTKEQGFGYAWMGYDDLYKDIEKLCSTTDRVVVFVHAGLEHYPIPLPEVRDFYHKLCDAGVSAVIGGHPHSAQGYEFYNNKLIVYSLGNFYFPLCEGLLPEENSSYSILIDFEKDGDININPVYHILDDNCVKAVVNDKDKIDLPYLCELLGDEYSSRAEEMCVIAYIKLISRLLSEATCGEFEGMGVKQALKRAINTTLLRRQFVTKTKDKRKKLLLHLFENETYRWTTIRALNKLVE